MAPTASTMGNTAQSTLLSSPSIITPIIIIVSSAAGISVVLFFAVLTVTSYRRVHAEQAAKLRNTIVPRLVITDTSMSPTSNMVVNGEADLDKVIASFKPIGADLHIPETEIAAFDVCSPRLGDGEDEQLFPLPKLPTPKRASDVISEGCHSPYYNGEDEETDFSSAHRSSQPDCIRVTIRPVSNFLETDEPVWWYDFHVEESYSGSSLSDANKSVSSGSLHSTNSSCDALVKFNSPTKSSGTNISTIGRVQMSSINVVEYHDTDHPRDAHKPEVGTESQETSYDKDILAYCWKLSDDAANATYGSSSSPNHESINTTNIGRMVSSRSKRRSLRSRASSGTYDQNILETYWRLYDGTSLKSVRDTDDIRSTRIRHTSAARSVTEASILGPDSPQIQSHDSGYIVLSPQRKPSRRASVK